ncbi:endonuclease/exonuclease/phosphatase family protein [Steroidobacter sp. S1-65]|uniref:Endonuclease/exonuclease/phosphatase family protein n=1 Tax=Steroidobacter gossypii TaxID=2805490 RepID=A0ABS1WSI6_9GAMM|nr:endonuclease/exonuclease/phosphatase family protein [Steroidobacter gossypii]MBM0103946.1 endonuclease/exonuclease/phosphatase family protein [Steroidobacter gossypii]
MSRDTVLRKSVQLASLALVGLWLALLAGLLGRWAWPLDLFAHFRVQYAALFAVLAVITLLLRHYVHASAALLGFAISVVPLFPYVSDQPVSAAIATPREETFRLVSFNVWFRNPDLVPTAQYIEQSQADAVVLLELTPPQAEQLAPLLPSYPYYHIEPSRMGAAVFTKWPVLEAESVPLAPGGAVAAKLKLDWRGAPVTVLGVHLNWPLGPRNSEFRNQELNELVRFSKAQPGPLIVAGDFNLTPWSGYFSKALEQSGLHDAARGFGLARSWPAQFAPAGIRIDHCLLSPQWRSVSTRVGPFLGSDHLPIVADLTLQQ